MATEILVNDGGAPARILPFTAGSTIAAGEPVGMATPDGEIDSANTALSGTRALGVSLTAVTSGSICNVISGRGVILNASVSGTAAIGSELEMSGLGDFQPYVYLADGGRPTALALAAHSGNPSLARILLL
tara:strand:- start:242 stop:634 length:393 start_codon:yes stop_codon:yes gene_type:complete